MKTELKPVWFQFAVGDAERFAALVNRIRSENPGVNKTGALKIICDRLEKLDRDRDGQRRRDQRRPRNQKRAVAPDATGQAPRSDTSTAPVARGKAPRSEAPRSIVLDDPVRKL